MIIFLLRSISVKGHPLVVANRNVWIDKSDEILTIEGNEETKEEEEPVTEAIVNCAQEPPKEPGVLKEATVELFNKDL